MPGTIADIVRDERRPILVFPQDYHLYLVPFFLRSIMGDRVHIQPFVHIPWPGPDAWRILPRDIRSELLYAMLESDRIGFQTRKDAFNFVQTCRFYLPDAHSKGSRESIHYDDRVIGARAYPISVDVDQLRRLVDQPEVKRIQLQIERYVGGAAVNPAR